jgi:hypothetical protein
VGSTIYDWWLFGNSLIYEKAPLERGFLLVQLWCNLDPAFTRAYARRLTLTASALGWLQVFPWVRVSRLDEVRELIIYWSQVQALPGAPVK